MPPSEPYDVDLAYVHDAGYGHFAKLSAPGLLSVIAQYAVGSRLVVDLGCGSGIWPQALADAGYQVVGIDVSAAMLEIASRRVPQAEFHVGSFVDCAIPPCRAVTAVGEVFNYLFDPQNSLSTLRQICQKVFDALIPGGAFIFDIAEPGRCGGLKRGFSEGPDWACLVEFLHDEPQQQLTRRIVTFRQVGDTYRRHEESHHQQLYERAAITEILHSIGFQVEVVAGYGTHSFPPAVVGFVARKGNA